MFYGIIAFSCTVESKKASSIPISKQISEGDSNQTRIDSLQINNQMSFKIKH